MIVDNTPPTVSITQPAALAYVKQPRDLLGTANDANLASYVLEMAPGTLANATQFIEVSTGAEPVSAGTLGRWKAMPPDGVHTLRLKAVDQAENTSETLLQVTVDTNAPAAPNNLTGRIEGNDGRAPQLDREHRARSRRLLRVPRQRAHHGGARERDYLSRYQSHGGALHL